MELTSLFNLQASVLPIYAAPKRPARRVTPFSLRLNDAERARLLAEAKGVPLGTYIKAKMLGDAPVGLRRTGLAVEDRSALAQALALLGHSHLAGNLNQLAQAAHIGTLLVTKETEAALGSALAEVRAIRSLLMTAPGLKPEAAP